MIQKTIITIVLIIFVQLSFAQDVKSAFDTTTYGRNPAVGKYADIRGFKMYYETTVKANLC